MQVESYNYVDIKDEISKSKITSGLSIAGTMICLNNDRNAYTSSGMISIGEKAFIMPDLEFPFYGISPYIEKIKLDEETIFYNELKKSIDCGLRLKAYTSRLTDSGLKIDKEIVILH